MSSCPIRRVGIPSNRLKGTTSPGPDRAARRQAVPLDESELLTAQKPTAENDGLTELLQKLSVEHRAVVSLRYGEEMPLEEIAETLNIPLGTVKSRMYYAIEFLRKLNNET